jgi:hypothetical protein
MDTSETYRRILRISATVMAAVLLFQSGLIDSRTTAVFDQTTSYLGATVGMSVSVEPNEFNTFTTEIARQQQLLSEREEVLTEREIAVALNTGDESATSRTTYLLAAVLFVQLILIVLNYSLDYLRSREHELFEIRKQISG